MTLNIVFASGNLKGLSQDIAFFCIFFTKIRDKKCLLEIFRLFYPVSTFPDHISVLSTKKPRYDMLGSLAFLDDSDCLISLTGPTLWTAWNLKPSTLTPISVRTFLNKASVFSSSVSLTFNSLIFSRRVYCSNLVFLHLYIFIYFYIPLFLHLPLQK